MSRPRQLVLASASPRRRDLLARLGLQFTIDPAGIDERPPDGISQPEDIARELARQKGNTVANANPKAAILAADTIVTLDGNQLGKPATADEAHAMLTALRGRWHTVITGMALACDRNIELAYTATSVLMRDYTGDEIGATIDAGTSFDKAGGYAIQDTALQPVARYEGCYCNVVGLPLATTISLLRQAGFTVPVIDPADLLPECRTCPLFDRSG